MNDIAVKSSFKRWAQLGYAARGVVYLVVGGLALLAAFGGNGGATTSSRGAILKIFEQPYGQVMVGVMALGLFGYVMWRFLQAVQDTDNHGASAKGLAVRAGLMVSAITHLMLAVWAVMLLVGNGDSSSSSQQQAEGLLANGYGQLGIGLIGVAIIISGFAQIFKGWTARFERYMRIPPEQQGWARPVCRFGLIARGIVWFIIGWFLIRSAYYANAGDVGGMAEALAAVRQADYGPWLLAIVAAGLFSFGVYSVLEALYRRINADW